VHVCDASAFSDVRRESNRQMHSSGLRNDEDPSGKASNTSEDCLQQREETV
jgi:hypothetical protein